MDSTAAREVLESFATKAFRGRKPSPAYLDKLVELFAAELAASGKPILRKEFSSLINRRS